MRRAALLLMLATATATPAKEPTRVEHTAAGTFDVTPTPAPGATAAIGDMTIAKTFHGPLSATSTGRMLAVRTPVDGSAAYVAMETVTGTLDGRTGGFALQHSGTMEAGARSLSVTVVPDSATDQLRGLRGRMEIEIVGEEHRYTFRYSLPG